MNLNTLIRNFGKCPYCGSEDDIEPKELIQSETENQPPINHFVQTITCGACDGKWRESWQLISVKGEESE